MFETNLLHAYHLDKSQNGLYTLGRDASHISECSNTREWHAALSKAVWCGIDYLLLVHLITLLHNFLTSDQIYHFFGMFLVCANVSY